MPDRARTLADEEAYDSWRLRGYRSLRILPLASLLRHERERRPAQDVGLQLESRVRDSRLEAGLIDREQCREILGPVISNGESHGKARHASWKSRVRTTCQTMT